MSAKGNAINSEAALWRSLLRGGGRLLWDSAFLGLMANFVKNLFIDVSLGRTPLLYYDLACTIVLQNHRISAVKGLENEEAFSASRLPKQSGAHNIALAGINKQCDQREYHHPGNAPGALQRQKTIHKALVVRLLIYLERSCA